MMATAADDGVDGVDEATAGERTFFAVAAVDCLT